MPNIGFILPHWLYWAGLAIFPLVAMILARRNARADQAGYSVVTAGFIWLVGGFLGLHRLYLKNRWGMLYWPLFALILYASGMERDARVVLSDARAELEVVDRSIARSERRIEKSGAQIKKAQAQLAEITADEESRKKRLERKLAKEEGRVEEARTKIETLKADVGQLQSNLETATGARATWAGVARYAFFGILAFLAFDLLRLPALCRAANARLATHPEPPIEREELQDDARFVGRGLAGAIDRLSLLSGEYVAFWAVLAVFTYYYEVVVRYVFNSPTNWAHESMFLMFGMQYLIAGSYAMLTESHVRVDIFYARFSPRGKAFVDLLTSIFFFIFAGTLLATGWIFARDAMQGANWEVSFTEWAIQYWPVKISIVVGAVLLILQGISQVLKDIVTLVGPAEEIA